MANCPSGPLEEFNETSAPLYGRKAQLKMKRFRTSR